MSAPVRSEAIVLDFPVQLADRLLTEVTMRRPIVKDLREHMQRGRDDGENEINMFAALCNMRVEEIEMIGVADYVQLQALYGRFCTPSKRKKHSGRGAETQQGDQVEQE